MKKFSLLKKCVTIFTLLCGIIVATNLNAQTFNYNDLIFSVSSSGGLIVVGHVNGTSATGEVVIPASVNYNGLNYSVTIIGNDAFRDCSGLVSITIPNSVTIIASYAFSKCSSLTSISIPNSVTTIEHSVFSHCSSLTNITIPNSVTAIGEMAFMGCSGLTSITIPNSVTVIDEMAFMGCSGLTSITIPNSVIIINHSAFWECSGLNTINVDNDNPIYDSRDNCNAIIKTADNELIAGCKNTIIPNSVIKIGISAFWGCSGLISITIPNSVTTIGANAFAYCSDLTCITISNSVTTIGVYVFRGCINLTEISVDDGNPVYDSRDNCNAIIKTADNELIAGCKNTIIPNSVITIGISAFYECSSLTSINIPNSVITIRSYAFMDCSGLVSITIPNSVTTIEGWAFLNCSSLTSISIPNSVTTIEDSVFLNCSSLTSITIPNSVTAIGEMAFGGCSSLTSITIPDSVTTIGSDAFSGCSRLKQVISLSQIPPNLGTSAFYGVFDAILFVPQNCVPLYEASSWSDYFSIILEYHESVSEVDEISASLYPNPTVGKIIIEADGIKNISIYSVSGQLIYETPATGNVFEYDFGNHDAGVYLVKIETVKGIVTRKVTVK